MLESKLLYNFYITQTTTIHLERSRRIRCPRCSNILLLWKKTILYLSFLLNWLTNESIYKSFVGHIGFIQFVINIETDDKTTWRKIRLKKNITNYIQQHKMYIVVLKQIECKMNFFKDTIFSHSPLFSILFSILIF